jgi:dienelactone hydrolase
MWEQIRPAPRTNTLTSFTAVLLALTVGASLGSDADSGEGLWVDVGVGTGLALGGVVGMLVVIWVLSGLPRLMDQLFGRFGFAAMLAIFLLLDKSWLSLNTTMSAVVAFALVTVSSMLSGSMAGLVDGFRRKTPWAKVTTVALGVAGLTATVLSLGWLMNRGNADHVVRRPVMVAANLPPMLAVGNPSLPGPFGVRALSYGSGTDIRRTRFSDAVQITTESVDGTHFAEWPSGWRGELRERFWGFDTSRLPRNALVWYPEGAGPFPLAVIVHGNRTMADDSEAGFEYLGRLMASHGFIFCSVDENFLNGSFVGGLMKGATDCRAWLLLKHLELWREWNSTDGHPFQGKVDLANIALLGHSRGGEAVCLAAVFNRLSRDPEDALVEFDFQFDLKAIVAIAPTAGQYLPAGKDTIMRDLSYLALQGAHDADVSSFRGDQHYNRLQFSGPGNGFKSSIYLYRANHGQFNSEWGGSDMAPPDGWMLNKGALMSGEDQREIGKVYISAFLQATCQDRGEYLPLFANHLAGRGWLPEDALLVNRFEDRSFRLLTDYEEDADVTTTSLPGGSITARGLVVWREGDIPLRGGGRRFNAGVFLGWAGGTEESQPASYNIHIPEALAFKLTAHDVLAFDLGESKEKAEAKAASSGKQAHEEVNHDNVGQDRAPLDVSVELVGRDGSTARLPLSRFGVIAPPLEVRITRTDYTESRYPGVEPVLQTFRLPLSAFVESSPTLKVDEIATVSLVFDRESEGVVIVDRVGFTAGSR